MAVSRDNEYRQPRFPPPLLATSSSPSSTSRSFRSVPPLGRSFLRVPWCFQRRRTSPRDTASSCFSCSSLSPAITPSAGSSITDTIARRTRINYRCFLVIRAESTNSSRLLSSGGGVERLGRRRTDLKSLSLEISNTVVWIFTNAAGISSTNHGMNRPGVTKLVYRFLSSPCDSIYAHEASVQITPILSPRIHPGFTRCYRQMNSSRFRNQNFSHEISRILSIINFSRTCDAACKDETSASKRQGPAKYNTQETSSKAATADRSMSRGSIGLLRNSGASIQASNSRVPSLFFHSLSLFASYANRLRHRENKTTREGKGVQEGNGDREKERWDSVPPGNNPFPSPSFSIVLAVVLRFFFFSAPSSSCYSTSTSSASSGSSFGHSFVRDISDAVQHLRDRRSLADDEIEPRLPLSLAFYEQHIERAAQGPFTDSLETRSRLLSGPPLRAKVLVTSAERDPGSGGFDKVDTLVKGTMYLIRGRSGPPIKFQPLSRAREKLAGPSATSERQLYR